MSKFEITDTRSMTVAAAEKAINDHYSDKLTYNGIEFFDSIYMDTIVPAAQDDLCSASSWRDGQESYLGYLPDKDIFVSGWDTWSDDGDGSRNVVFLKVTGKREATVVRELDDSAYYGMMYCGNGKVYDKLKKKYPQLVDIRLD